jgi:hypothetical protein
MSTYHVTGTRTLGPFITPISFRLHAWNEEEAYTMATDYLWKLAVDGASYRFTVEQESAQQSRLSA